MAAICRFFCRLSGEKSNVVVEMNCTRRFLDEMFPSRIFDVVNGPVVERRFRELPPPAWMPG